MTQIESDEQCQRNRFEWYWIEALKFFVSTFWMLLSIQKKKFKQKQKSNIVMNLISSNYFQLLLKTYATALKV